AQYLAQAIADAIDGHQADTHAHRERAVLPGETELLGQAADAFGDRQRLLDAAVIEQDAKLVSAQASQQIAAAHAASKQRRQLAQQFIAGDMAAGVVDDLELIEIEIAQDAWISLVTARLQQQFETALEFGAVNQAGQGIMSSLIGQLAGEFPGCGHIPKREYRANQLTLRVPDRRGGVEHGKTLPIAPQQCPVL